MLPKEGQASDVNPASKPCPWTSPQGFPKFQPEFSQSRVCLFPLSQSQMLVKTTQMPMHVPLCTLGYVCKFYTAYSGTKKHSILSHLQCQEFDSRLLRKADFSQEGNIFVREVCVRLFHLLTAEPEDNKDYLTETSIDKWYTFLNSFQSTKSYFISFSKALNNLQTI